MLEYVEVLTLRPWETRRSHVEGLKAVGLSDRDILDLNQVTAYFAYVNRIADGLGVELEPYAES